MKKMFGLIFAALVILGVVFLARLGHSCNPGAFMPYPVFINTLHPDLPIDSYQRGNLGIVQPTYGSAYLYVAYRDLAGPPVRPTEEEDLWHGDPRIIGPRTANPAEMAESPHDWEQEWESATGQEKPAVDSSLRWSFNYQPGAGVYREIAMHESGTTFHSQFLNCPQGAFREALDTLKQRTQQYGEASGMLQNWLAAQQTVFGNCGTVGTIPDDLPPTAPALARADRAYQQAAAYFYAGEYDQAIAAFQAIAKDAASPWSTIAPYLVARALVREATVNDKFQPDLATLGQAETQVESVLANPQCAQYHHAAEQLRGLIEFRVHPDERLGELAVSLMRIPSDPDLKQDLIDFKLLFSRATGDQDWPHVGLINDDTYAKFAGERAKSPLLDWMLTFRLGASEAYSHSLEKWKSTHSPAWLVAALTKADGNSPELADLLGAARQVPPSAPAYFSVTFHSLRLLVLQGKETEARERLAQLKARQLGPFQASYEVPPSTGNLFRALRFKLAQNLGELFENAPRVPATITTLNSSQQLPELNLPRIFSEYDESSLRFDDDALVVLNRQLPVAILAKAVANPRLPEDLRHEIALAAWTRAVLLGDSTTAHGLAPAVETFYPVLSANVKAYEAAGTAAGRRFAAALAALRFPGLRPYITTDERDAPIDEIDNYRQNWWAPGGPPCVYPQGLASDQQNLLDPLTLWPPVRPVFQTLYPGGQVKAPAFLTAKESSEAAEELRQLVALGTGPDYLCRQAIAWANAHPEDPRAPEALALAVKSTRYGCTDQQTGPLSKAAFELLHRRYPKSSWADQTKYWFK